MTEKKPRGRPRKNTYTVPAKDQVKNPVGRPKTEIDLGELRRLCRLNCTMPEIAAFLEIPLRTLEDRYTNDNDVREAIQSGRELGKLSIRRKQIQIMEQQNSATMAIWLGKNLLGQRDNLDVTTEDKGQTELAEAMGIVTQLAKIQKQTASE